MKDPWEILADLLLIAGIGWILFHLVTVAVHGQSLIVVEPNKPLAWTEIAVTSLMLLLGFQRLYSDFKHRKRRR